MTDVFREVRERLDMDTVARHYGYEPNQAGFISCPFHREKTASLKLYPGAKGFYCFGCHAGGSVVDFTAQLFDLDALGAVRQLNDDFHLGLPVDRQQTPQERAEAAKVAAARRELSDTAKAFEAWRSATLDKLNVVFRTAHLALKDCQTLDELTEAESLAIKWQASVEYWADCLLYGDMAAQMDIFRERKEVEQLCNRILSNTPMKFGAA